MRPQPLSAWVADLAKWSHPGMHVKRWLLLLLIGLTSVALGVAFFLVQLYRTQPFPDWVYYFTLQPVDRLWRGTLFLFAGAGVIAYGIIQLNRSLMAAVQPPYVADGGRLVDVVYNYRLPQRRPQVAAFAGHRGFVALQQHRELYAKKLLGIASVADGPLPEDVLGPQVPGGDRLLYPVDNALELCAELEHGTILEGAGAIRARRSGVPIKRVFLVRRGENPERVLREDSTFLRYVDVPVRAETLYAIREADVLLFGPGSLYLNLLPTLLVREVREAIQASRARKILITGLMTEPGQTDHFGVADFVRAVHAYGGFKLDYVLVNSTVVDGALQGRYSAALASPVLPVELDGRGEGRDVIVAAGRRLRKLSTAEGAVIVAAPLARRMSERVPAAPGDGTALQSTIVYRHDPERLAMALAALLGVNAASPAGSAN